MSILSDHSLAALYPDITPGPASIDLHIGSTLLWWPPGVKRDPRTDQSSVWHFLIPDSGSDERLGWVLRPGVRYLASTRERVTIRPDCAGQISARSSWGRDGLAVICGPAGWLDPGFDGTVTLELSVVGSELVLWPGASIAQLVIHRLTSACERPYDGKYQGQSEATPSRLHEEVQS